MFDPNADASPFNPLPPVIWALVALIMVPEVILSLGARGIIGGPEAVGWRLDLARAFGFFDPLFEWMVENRQYPVEGTRRFLTYVIVGEGFVTSLIAAVILLALGNVVGRVFSPLAVVSGFGLSAVAGALSFGLFEPFQDMLIGAWPPVYGVMGMYCFVQYQIGRRTGAPWIMAFRLPMALLVFQLVFFVAFGAIGTLSADIGAFFAGFGLSYLIGPGSAARIRGWRDTLRNR